MAHFVLVPGLWLDGSSWSRVVPVLEEAGHSTEPLTLPGMEDPHADRSSITLHDHVAAVVAAIEAAQDEVVLVGHSAGCAVAYAATDARPELVSHAVYVGGFPTPHGRAPADGFASVDGEVALPDWSAFDDADVADLDEDARAEFRERAIPSPARVASDQQELTDERRYEVPVTVICPEFTAQMLRGWVEQGLAPVVELGLIRQVEYVDLPAGHWPQLTRPDDLARAILASLSPGSASWA